MGVDIYGKAPKLIGKKPELDYSDDNITDKQQERVLGCTREVGR